MHISTINGKCFRFFSVTPYYHAQISCFLAQIRSGGFCQHGHWGLSGNQDRGNGKPSRDSELIAMGVREYFDQTMSSQHPQLAPCSGGATASFFRRAANGIIEMGLEFAIAKAVEIEFSATNGFQQNPICAP